MESQFDEEEDEQNQDDAPPGEELQDLESCSNADGRCQEQTLPQGDTQDASLIPCVDWEGLPKNGE